MAKTHEPGEPLTKRELEALRGLARGDRPEQIAAAHYLSPATVRSHIKTARQKLDARTAAAAVALGYDFGLLELGAAGPGAVCYFCRGPLRRVAICPDIWEHVKPIPDGQPYHVPTVAPGRAR